MFSFGHRAGTLLLGLTIGVVLAGSLALAVPEAVPTAARVDDDAALAAPPAIRKDVAPAAAPTAPVAAPAPAPASTAPLPTTTVAPAPPKPPAPATVAAPTTRREVLRAPGPAEAVIAATNAERKSAGCGALVRDARLTTAAQEHASDMASRRYLSHTDKDGDTFDERIRDAGYSSPGGENIARGQRTAAEVVQDWMESAGHRRNIEDCSFRTIGVGYAGDYWVQDFGR
ncbi:CAP domain-containing protein [Pseudonocardia xinjiangensis]|uniref:CAP domain-containing protein n=1 Tax=Pseudonocardia xinjiangensis TaxID=75289 RepID=UPI003D8FEE4F